MEGIILHYDETAKKGVVRGDSGERFEFTDSDWKSNSSPRVSEKIDFMAKDGTASEIYAVSKPGPPRSAAEGQSNFLDSGLVKKISALFSNGMHNKFGFFATLAVLISMFLPLIEIPLLGKFSFIDYGIGKFLFVLLIMLSIFFYGGATKLYTRILAGVVLGLFFFQYYDLFSGISQAGGLLDAFGEGGGSSLSFFDIMSWGALVNILACMILFMAAYFKKYLDGSESI